MLRYKTWADAGIEMGRASSGEIQTTCPECSPKRKKKNAKCLSVNLDKQVWLCHHCGFSGRLNDYVERGEYKHWRKPVYAKPKDIPATTPQGRALEWLQKRGISVKTAERNRIHTGTVWMPQIEDETTAIAFPYYRNGELINIKWRDHLKNFRLEAGAERILYGVDDIRDAEVVIWVEGEMDKLSVEECGLLNCVSVPNGAPAVTAKDYATHFAWFDDVSDLLLSKRHIIAVDNDEAGRKLADELVRRLGMSRCSRIEWPEGIKDANECLLAWGASYLRVMLDHPKPYPIDGVFTAMDVVDQINHLYFDGVEKGVSTGWPSLDSNFLVKPGEFTVVTGIPNSGKSNFIDDLCVHLAKLHGWSFAMFSPENQPIEDHISRIAEKYTWKPFAEGPTQRMSHQELCEANEWISDHFHWILPEDDSDWSIDQILERCQALVTRHGVRGLVIDPWNEIEHSSTTESETMYISRALKKIRQFGRRVGVHIFIVVHPKMLQKDSSGNYPVPTLYDCAGSAHWRNKADNGLVVWRDFSNPHNIGVDIFIQKIRFRQNGKLGKVTLSYNRITATYHEQSVALKEIPPIYMSEAV